MNSVGIYPGSFNPWHAGHEKLCKKLVDDHIVDCVVICPTDNYWDKTNLPDKHNRNHFIATTSCIEGKTLYFKAGPYPSDDKYTYDLLNNMNSLINTKGEDELYLVIGADNVKEFDKWYKYEEIINNYKIIVVGRGEKPDLSVFKDRVIYVEFDYPLSSTEIRRRLKEGETVIDGINYEEYLKWM